MTYDILIQGSGPVGLAVVVARGWDKSALVISNRMEEDAGLHALDDKDAEFLRQAREAYGEGEP